MSFPLQLHALCSPFYFLLFLCWWTEEQCWISMLAFHCNRWFEITCETLVYTLYIHICIAFDLFTDQLKCSLEVISLQSFFSCGALIYSGCNIYLRRFWPQISTRGVNLFSVWCDSAWQVNNSNAFNHTNVYFFLRYSASWCNEHFIHIKAMKKVTDFILSFLNWNTK